MLGIERDAQRSVVGPNPDETIDRAIDNAGATPMFVAAHTDIGRGETLDRQVTLDDIVE